MISQRLKLARSASGLSLRDLELRLDNRVTAQALSKYERDEMMPSSQVLMSLARALDVSEEYLLGEQDLALDGVEFRKKADMSTKEEAQVEARVLQLLERYLTVEEILGLPVEWDEPREAPYPVMQNVGEADRAARILREHWGSGSIRSKVSWSFWRVAESRCSRSTPRRWTVSLRGFAAARVHRSRSL